MDEPFGDRLVWSAGTHGTTTVFYVLPLRLLILFAGTWLAWRHFKSGRGDRRGATRLALFVFCCLLASWLLGAYHAISFGEYSSLVDALGRALYQATFYWVAYLAVEPLLRRYWPQGLISWTRLLAGSWRDPLVGRDLLVGCLLAPAFMVAAGAGALVSQWRGQPQFLSDEVWTPHLLGPRFAASSFFDGHVIVPLQNGLGLPFVFLLAYLLLRRKWFAGVTFVLLSLAAIPGEPMDRIVGASLVALVVRFGVLTTTSFFFALFLLRMMPMTTDLGLWYAGRTIFAVVLVAVLGLYGLRASLAGRPIFAPSSLGRLDGS